MKIFSEKNTELKDFEEVILDIEKERDTLDWCRASIRSCLWNLENPKIEQFDKDYFVKDLRVNLDKKEKAHAKLEYLKHGKLRAEMFRLNITTTPDRFLVHIAFFNLMDAILNQLQFELSQEKKKGPFSFH